MAKKRVNKNLVAFLTMMGVLLTVTVVAIATRQGAHKEPQFWAEKATRAREANDYELAIRLYERAYRDSEGPSALGKDVSYLVEAARCAYRWGEIMDALGELERARTEQPDHVDALAAYLEIVWEVEQPDYYWLLPPERRTTILEYAQALQAAEADAEKPHVVGPVSEAVARWALVDKPEPKEADWAPGDAALQRACALDENDFRVVRARIARENRQLAERGRQARAGGAPASNTEVLQTEFRTKIVAMLKAAVAAYPGEWRLVKFYVDELLSQADADLAQDRKDAAHEQLAEARAVMERALTEHETDPEIQLGMARFTMRETVRRREELSEEAFDQGIAQAARLAQRALDLEPGLFDAWVLLAQTELSKDLKRSASEKLPPERYLGALRVYDDALRVTPGVRSVKAAMGDYLLRRLMYVRACHTALEYFLVATTAEERETRREWLDKFLNATEVRFREEPFAYYLRGEAAIAQRQWTQALQAFERAEQLAAADTSPRYPLLWFQGFGGMLPMERLALLYREHGQPGESLKYTDQAMQQYASRAVRAQRGDAPPPLSLALNRAELLNLLGRPQEARDFAEGVRRAYGDALRSTEGAEVRLAAAEAEALRRLGRTQDAEKRLQAVTDDIQSLFMQAQLANSQGDAATVEARCREILALKDLRADLVSVVLQLLIPAMVEADRREQSKEILADVRSRFGGDANLKRLLDQFDLLVTYTDSAERDAKLLEQIAAEPDPAVRAGRSYSYYFGRGEYEKALPYLDELEKLQSDSPAVLAQQFILALRMQQYERASKYVLALSKANEGRGADQAGGATFRGQLHLSQGKYDDAIREFQSARDLLPRTAGLQVALGQALLGAGRVQDAVEAFQGGVEANPQDFDANKMLYIAYQSLPAERRPEDGGLAYLMKARELRPDDPFIKERAKFLDEEARPAEGIKEREQRRAENPDDVSNLIRLAQLYAKKQVGDEVRAVERLQEALRLEPGNTNLAQVATAFYASTGRRAEGEAHLRAFLESQKGPAQAGAHMLLARFYERLKDLPAAEAAFQSANKVLEETIENPAERRAATLDLRFELIEFFRRNPGKELGMIEACRWVLDRLNPDEPQEATARLRARMRIAQGLLSLGRLGEAESEVDALLKDYPDDANGMLVRAQLKLAKRQWQDAYTALGAVLQKFPQQSWALMNRGRLAMRYGRYPQAREDLVKARDQFKPPEDADAREHWRNGPDFSMYVSLCQELAGLYEVMEQKELAEATLREALKVAGEKADATEATQPIIDRLVALFKRTDQLDKGKQIASEFMARFPNSPVWPYRYGVVCVDQADKYTSAADTAREQRNSADERRLRRQAADQYETASASFEKGRQLALTAGDPVFAMRCEAYRLDSLAASGQFERAVQEFEQFSSSGPVTAVVRAAIIRAYHGLNRDEEAVKQLDAALLTASREAVRTVSAVIGLSQAYLPTERVLETLRAVAERLPADGVESFRIRNALAAQLLGTKKHAEALAVTDPVVTHAAPDAPERGAALLLRAQALSLSGDLDGAVALLEEMLKTFPNQPAAMNNLAFILADKANRPQEALPWAEKAYDQDPRNAAVNDTLGWVYFKNGKYEEAESVLKQALSIESENLPAMYHLGVLYADRARGAEARMLLRRLQTLATTKKDQEYEEKAQAALDQLH